MSITNAELANVILKYLFMIIIAFPIVIVIIGIYLVASLFGLIA